MAGTGRVQAVHMGRAGQARQAGQAAVEHLGLVLAVALALAAVAAWAATAMRPPSHPPDLVGAVARPLEGAPAAGRDMAGLAWAMRAPFVAGDGGRPVIGRGLRAILDWGLLNAEGEVVAGRSFVDRVRQRIEQLLDDPTRTLRDLGDLGLDDPRDELDRGWQDLLRYVGGLRRMRFRDAFLTVSRDLGSRAADAALARLVRMAGRAAARRAARRPPPPGRRRTTRTTRTATSPAPASRKPPDPARPAGTPRARRP